jgi:hypothetical protein
MFQVNVEITSDNTVRAEEAARKNRDKQKDVDSRGKPELRIIRIIGSSRNAKRLMNTCDFVFSARQRGRLPLETFQVKRRFAGLVAAAEKGRSDVAGNQILRRIGGQKQGVFY